MDTPSVLQRLLMYGKKRAMKFAVHGIVLGVFLAASPVVAAGYGVAGKAGQAGRIAPDYEQARFKKPAQVKRPVESTVLIKPRVESSVRVQPNIKESVYATRRVELPAIADVYRQIGARGLAAFPQRHISPRPNRNVPRVGNSATSYRLGSGQRNAEPKLHHRGYYTWNLRKRQPEPAY